MNTKGRKKLLLFLCTALLFVAGCREAGTKHYEGTNLQFDLPSADWEITYRVVNDENTLLELEHTKYAGEISLMACETTADCADTIFNTLSTSDAIMGTISGIKTENNLSEEGGTANYQYKVAASYGGEYWTIFSVKNAGDGKYILANGCIYILEDDKGNADKCKAEFDKLIKSIKYSDVADTGKAEKALNESTISSNVIGNYIKGGVSDYDYSMPTYDVETKLAEGCNYIYQTQVYGYDDSGECATVYVPLDKPSDAEGYGVFYWNNGIDFDLSPVGTFEYETPEHRMQAWMEDKMSYWKSNSTEYQNAVVDDKQTVDGGNAYTQHMAVERIDYNGNPSMQHYIIYYGKNDAGFVYVWEIVISHGSATEETNSILAELSGFYDIDLMQYGISADDLTMSGERVVEGQDDYIAKIDDKDIEKVDGYTYMGSTEIKTYDDVPYSVLIPIGKYLNFSNNNVSVNMHGVQISIRAYNSYRKSEMTEVVNDNIKYKYNYLIEKTRDYKNVELGEIKLIEDADGAYIALDSEAAMYNSDKFYPWHQIEYALALEGNDYLTITITLEEASFDLKTNSVLKDIEKAYHMDLSDYYYNP